MKIFKLLKNLLIGLYLSIKRFPVSIGLATAVSILGMIVFHNHNELSGDTRDILNRISMVLALGIPISLSLKLIFERKADIPKSIKILAYAAGGIFLVLYYLFLLNDFRMVSISRYVALTLAFYLAAMVTSYFIGRAGFELYVIKLFTRFFVTGLYSVILFGGIAAILFTIDKLLGVNIDEKLYMDIWISVVGIFAPCFFLAGVPQHDQEFETADYAKFLKVLLLYIIIPLIIAYTTILYIYFAKLLITFIWPIGMVANLVLWYGVITAVVFFFIAPLTKELRWVRLFVFWLSKIILPLLLMMFVSVGIRVKAYGITENRYYVIVLGLWVLGVMIYLSLSKMKRSIILPVSLAVIATLAVVGPWSSFSISKYSQSGRLENLLVKNQLLENNKIVKAGKDVSKADKGEISAILGYFSSNHDFKDIQYLPKNFSMDKMEEVFGFPSTYYSYNGRDTRYFYYNSFSVNEPVDIRGYDYLFMGRNYDTAPKARGEKLKVKYDYQSTVIHITLDDKEVYRKNASDFAKELYKKYGYKDKNDMDPVDATFIDENQQIRVKFVFQSLGGEVNTPTDEVKINGVEFYTLVSLK